MSSEKAEQESRWEKPRLILFCSRPPEKKNKNKKRHVRLESNELPPPQKKVLYVNLCLRVGFSETLTIDNWSQEPSKLLTLKGEFGVQLLTGWLAVKTPSLVVVGSLIAMSCGMGIIIKIPLISNWDNIPEEEKVLESAMTLDFESYIGISKNNFMKSNRYCWVQFIP